MDDQLVVEMPTPEVIEVPPAESIQAHAEQFDPKRKETAADAPQTAAVAAGETPEQKTRRRAKSQQATAADAPRIQQLTGRAKAAEERAAALETELATLRNGSSHAAPEASPALPADAKTQMAPRDPQDPEPQPQDAKFGGDYGAYLRDVTRWEVREQHRQIQFQNYQREQAQTVEQQKTARDQHWKTRIQVAAAKYSDLNDIAFGTPTPWEKNSLIDAFIEKDDNGIDLLYYLQSHPEERDSILQMSETRQARALSLILQRFDESHGAGQAGVTGSVASPRILKLPPRPPNPVRTEAHGAPAAPTDGSSSIAEHQKRFAPQSRRR